MLLHKCVIRSKLYIYFFHRISFSWTIDFAWFSWSIDFDFHGQMIIFQACNTSNPFGRRNLISNPSDKIKRTQAIGTTVCMQCCDNKDICNIDGHCGARGEYILMPRRVSLVEQELRTLPQHQSSPSCWFLVGFVLLDL
jgi:hypothetical protein